MEVRKKQRKVLSKSAGFEGEEVEEEDFKAQVQLLKQQGNTLAETGDFATALAKFSSACLMDAGDYTLHELKAQVLLQMARPFEAINAASQCVSLQPGWAEGWLTLARAQADFGELDLAMASIHTAAGLGPENAEISEELDRISRLQRELHTHRSALRSTEHLTQEGRTPATVSNDDDDPDSQEVARCLYNLSSRAHAVDNSNAETAMHLQT